MFANGGAPMRLHPDFAGDQWLRETLSCAPFAGGAQEVEPVWRALADRAGALGWTMPVREATGDPDLHILAGGRRIDPLSVEGERHVFAIPADHGPMHLVSRAARPCETTPWIDEPRRLGVLVRRLTARTGPDIRALPLDAPDFGPGWWETEWHAADRRASPGHGPCRWTNGDALLPEMGACLLEVVIGGTVTYPRDETATPIAVAEARAA
jgi:hypothetical protein